MLGTSTCIYLSASNLRRAKMSGSQGCRTFKEFLEDWSREAAGVPPPAERDDTSLSPEAETYAPPPCHQHPSPYKLYPGRLSATTFAVVIDGVTQDIRVMVPPILAPPPFRFELATLILDDSWEFQLKCDIDKIWSRPTPPKTVKHIERQMGKRSQPNRKCLVCGTSTRAKRNQCL